MRSSAFGTLLLARSVAKLSVSCAAEEKPENPSYSLRSHLTTCTPRASLLTKVSGDETDAGGRRKKTNVSDPNRLANRNS